MARKAPGKSHRKGLTLLEVADMFRDEDTAREWIEEQRWPGGPRCPDCDTKNVQSHVKHPTMTHRCRECPGKPFFSFRKRSVMERSKIPYRSWAIALYLFTTNLKGISSMRLHRELGISQKSAWFILHRLRKAAETGVGPFAGPVEVDETYLAGSGITCPRSGGPNCLAAESLARRLSWEQRIGRPIKSLPGRSRLRTRARCKDSLVLSRERTRESTRTKLPHTRAWPTLTKPSSTRFRSTSGARFTPTGWSRSGRL